MSPIRTTLTARLSAGPDVTGEVAWSPWCTDGLETRLCGWILSTFLARTTPSMGSSLPVLELVTTVLLLPPPRNIAEVC
uniref:Uncharacterized protein n=1 Tax=Triticum urartu TaxID=4572 RepID=A0A8R7JWU8_TRIUA